MHRFLLPASYPARTIEIDKFLKAGPPKEVYEMAKFDTIGIKEQILKAFK
jgi:hypothetical protein